MEIHTVGSRLAIDYAVLHRYVGICGKWDGFLVRNGGLLGNYVAGYWREWARHAPLTHMDILGILEVDIYTSGKYSGVSLRISVMSTGVGELVCPGASSVCLRYHLALASPARAWD